MASTLFSRIFIHYYACLFGRCPENASLFMEADSVHSTEIYLKFLSWVHANRKALIIAGIAVAVIGIAFGFMSWQKSQTEAAADAQLMNVPLTSTRDGRIAAAPASSFMDLANKYPDSSAGGYAVLLGAESLFLEGKYPEAHQAFSKFIEEQPTSPLIAQAKVGLAASLEGEGKLSEAAQKYQEIVVTYPMEQSIVSPVKLTLAHLDEQLNKPQQALQYYEDLARIPAQYDPWAAEARERGTILLMKHPELRKPPPGATGAPSAGPPGSQLLNLSPTGAKPPAGGAPAQKPPPSGTGKP